MDTTQLTKQQAARYAELKQTAKQGMDSFFRVGEALAEIRDEKLYRDEYETFEAFCKNEYGIARSTAYQFIDASKVVENLGGQMSAIADKSIPSSHLPKTESQARPLTELPPAEQVEAWKQVIETSPKDKSGNPKVTAAHVRKTVDKAKGKAADAAKNPAAEPATEPTPPAEDQPTDRTGKVITDPTLIEVFADKRIPRARQLLKEVRTEINALLGNGNDRKPLPLARLIEPSRQKIVQQLENVDFLLKHGTPYEVCPYPHKGASGCEYCQSSGWISKSQSELVPAEYRRAGKGAA